MGIENPTAHAESQESNAERSERDIQSDLVALDAQLASIPPEEATRYDAYHLGKYVDEDLKRKGIEEGNPNLPQLSKEEADGLQKYDALLEQKGEVEKERNAFYEANPDALRVRLKEISKAVLLENLNADSEAKDLFLEEGFARNYMREPAWESPYRRELRDLDQVYVKSAGERLERDHYKLEVGDEILQELKGSKQETNSKIPSFTERVSPTTAEFVTNHILEKDLSYQDTDLSEEQKQGILREQQVSSKAKRYAESLANASNTVGLESVRTLARAMRDTMTTEASHLGIPVSPYGKSLTWAMWDTGKQYHFFTNQDQNDSRYEIGNPLESEPKREEIINRQLGWEAYAAFQNNPEYRERTTNTGMSSGALELFNKSPKSNGTLSSRDLAELGKALRA